MVFYYDVVFVAWLYYWVMFDVIENEQWFIPRSECGPAARPLVTAGSRPSCFEEVGTFLLNLLEITNNESKCRQRGTCSEGISKRNFHSLNGKGATGQYMGSDRKIGC